MSFKVYPRRLLLPRDGLCIDSMSESLRITGWSALFERELGCFQNHFNSGFPTFSHWANSLHACLQTIPSIRQREFLTCMFYFSLGEETQARTLGLPIDESLLNWRRAGVGVGTAADLELLLLGRPMGRNLASAVAWIKGNLPSEWLLTDVQAEGRKTKLILEFRGRTTQYLVSKPNADTFLQIECFQEFAGKRLLYSPPEFSLSAYRWIWDQTSSTTSGQASKALERFLLRCHSFWKYAEKPLSECS